MHITMILASLYGGGAERSAINLATGFAARGIHVEILLLQDEGAMFDQLPDAINVTVYHHSRVLNALFDLKTYFNNNHPDAVISFLNQTNLVVLLAHSLANSTVPVIPTVRSNLTINRRDSLKERIIIFLSRFVFSRAARIIGVSDGVSDSVRQHITSHNVETIYNPTNIHNIIQKMQQPIPHVWLQSKEKPVIIAAGRLVPAKGFDVLITALAYLRDKLPARLIILGEGPLRAELEAMISQLDLNNDIQLPGYTDNPYAFFRYADVFVLSSRYEGLPNALIEAMVCSTPVVATDCESGPREILVNGKFGPLVPVDNAEALADAIYQTLSTPPNRDKIKARAMDFSIERSVDHFLRVIEAVCHPS